MKQKHLVSKFPALCLTTKCDQGSVHGWDTLLFRRPTEKKTWDLTWFWFSAGVSRRKIVSHRHFTFLISSRNICRRQLLGCPELDNQMEACAINPLTSAAATFHGQKSAPAFFFRVSMDRRPIAMCSISFQCFSLCAWNRLFQFLVNQCWEMCRPEQLVWLLIYWHHLLLLAAHMKHLLSVKIPNPFVLAATVILFAEMDSTHAEKQAGIQKRIRCCLLLNWAICCTAKQNFLSVLWRWL